jgi:hypothetical protein
MLLTAFLHNGYPKINVGVFDLKSQVAAGALAMEAVLHVGEVPVNKEVLSV